MGAGTRSPSTAVRRSTRRRRPIPRSRGSRARTRESARRNRSRRPRECCVGVWHPAVICAASRRVPLRSVTSEPGPNLFKPAQ